MNVGFKREFLAFREGEKSPNFITTTFSQRDKKEILDLLESIIVSAECGVISSIIRGTWLAPKMY